MQAWLFIGVALAATPSLGGVAVHEHKPHTDTYLVANIGVVTPVPDPVEAFDIEVIKETPEQVIRRQFGKDSDLMLNIARCESNLSQTEPDGSPLIGKITPLDRGVFQISLKYHKQELDKLGLDAHILEDNVSFAKILFDRNGTRDWSASHYCWGQY